MYKRKYMLNRKARDCIFYFVSYAWRVVLSQFLYEKPHAHMGRFPLSLMPGVSKEVTHQCTSIRCTLSGHRKGHLALTQAMLKLYPFPHMEDSLPKLYESLSLRLSRCQRSLFLLKIAFHEDILLFIFIFLFFMFY